MQERNTPYQNSSIGHEDTFINYSSCLPFRLFCIFWDGNSYRLLGFQYLFHRGGGRLWRWDRPGGAGSGDSASGERLAGGQCADAPRPRSLRGDGSLRAGDLA